MVVATAPARLDRDQGQCGTRPWRVPSGSTGIRRVARAVPGAWAAGR